jgi:hypothetical protein
MIAVRVSEYAQSKKAMHAHVFIDGIVLVQLSKGPEERDEEKKQIKKSRHSGMSFRPATHLCLPPPRLGSERRLLFVQSVFESKQQHASRPGV